MKNKVMTAQEALSIVKAGDKVMVGGFGLRGCPFKLIDALCALNVDELTIISNDLGSPNEGLGRLLTNKQIKALVGNFYNWNPDVAMARNSGEIEVELVPQGTFAEAIRAAGAGIPAFYTATGVGTDLGVDKETRTFDDREYLLAKAISADVALIKAHIADEMGNLLYYKSSRNFNPAMAMAARYTIVEVDEIVPVGQLDPENIMTQHIYVDAIVKGGN